MSYAFWAYTDTKAFSGSTRSRTRNLIWWLSLVAFVRSSSPEALRQKRTFTDIFDLAVNVSLRGCISFKVEKTVDGVQRRSSND
jgi:hypothetical protein